MFINRSLYLLKSQSIKSVSLLRRFTEEQITKSSYINTLYKQSFYSTKPKIVENETYTKYSDILQKIEKHSVKDVNEKKVFAVIHFAGSQFKVAHNDVFMINKKIEAECGELIKLEKVLAVGGNNFTLIGQPLLKRGMVNVEAMVVEKTKGEKKIVFKMKKRKGYKRWKGHRQDLSVLKIQSIEFDTSLL